jgi:hypothetical protein
MNDSCQVLEHQDRQNRLRYVYSAAILLLLGTALIFEAQAQSSDAPKYAPNGDLLVPTGFETWVFVGSNLGLAYDEEARGTSPAVTRTAPSRFHNVYINKEAYFHFRASREFPDPTILVMQVFSAADKETRGVLTKGVFNGERTGLSVAVKNSSRPDGSKTVWAYYSFTDQSDQSKVRASASAFPDQSCESCHRQHASKDNVWVQFYPTLRDLAK